MGLKQAAPTFGNNVRITTKRHGDSLKYRYYLDKRAILSNPVLLKEDKIKIEKHPLESADEVDKHFFELKITELTVKNQITDSNISYLRKQLGVLFRSYIDTNQLRILVNGKEVKRPQKPKLIKLPSYKTDKVPFEDKKLGLSGWWGITKAQEENRSKQFGMDTFYNDRLITQGDIEIAGITSKHPNYYRLEGQVHFRSPCIFDNNITSSKNSWVKDDNYISVVELLDSLVHRPYLKEIENVRTEDKQSKLTKKLDVAAKLLPAQLRKIFPELNKKTGSTEKRRAHTGEKPVGLDVFLVEERKTPENPSDNPGGDEGFEDKRKPRKEHPQTREYVIVHLTINNLKYKIQIRKEFDWSEKDPRYSYNLDETNQVLIISINMSNAYVENDKDADDRLMTNVLEWAIESILCIEGFSSTKEFIDERETKLALIDYNEWLNEITDGYLETIEPSGEEEQTTLIGGETKCQ